MTADLHGIKPYPFLHLALPVKDEPDSLPGVLECLSAQSYKRFNLYVCVNQPDSWWHDKQKKTACEHNAESIRLLKSFKEFDIRLIDHSSPGKGWTGKKTGVGFARRALMDAIDRDADPGDVIVSLDADTLYGTDYLLSVATTFLSFPDSVALAVPYFHREDRNPATTRSMLRYEIYMRYYLLNLFRIGSPYAFTALGSAMACRVLAYRAIGGITPKLSGEDFYFLQKLKKFGNILNWNDVPVYPDGRISDRVFFGTGPAIIKGNKGDWSGYPIYPETLFDKILETYLLLPLLFSETIRTDVIDFLAECFEEKDPLRSIRLNHPDPDRFIRAFHEKFDGLRILQFLKSRHKQEGCTDTLNLKHFIKKHFGEKTGKDLKLNDETSLDAAPIEVLRKIRMLLFEIEMECRFSSTPG